VVGFDDLREAVYKTYLQMKDYNLVATSFATTDNMGTKSGSTSGLKLDQIKEMYDYGWDFQLHSKWHIDYNLKLYLLNDAQKGDTAITVDIKDNSAPFYNSKLTNSAPWDSDRMIYSLYLGSDLFINEEEVTIKCIDPNKNIVYLKAPISREYLINDNAYVRQHPMTVMLDAKFSKKDIENWLGYTPEHFRYPWNSHSKKDDIKEIIRLFYKTIGTSTNSTPLYNFKDILDNKIDIAYQRIDTEEDMETCKKLIHHAVNDKKILFCYGHSYRPYWTELWSLLKDYQDEGKLFVLTISEAYYYVKTGKLPLKYK